MDALYRRTPSTLFHFPGGHRREVTPVPIPNTEVKLSTAEGTASDTAWESRSLPGLFLLQGPSPKRRDLFLRHRPQEGRAERRGPRWNDRRRWTSTNGWWPPTRASSGRATRCPTPPSTATCSASSRRTAG